MFKFKYICYFFIFIMFNVIYIALFLDKKIVSNKSHQVKLITGSIHKKQRDNINTYSKKINLSSDGSIDKIMQEINESGFQKVHSGKYKNIDEEKIIQTFTDESEVIEIGEYIDVDPEVTPQTEEESEAVEIGEYIDVDEAIYPQRDTEDSEIIEIGQYIDVDAEKLNQAETEGSEVTEIGKYIDVEAEVIYQNETEYSEVAEIGEHMDVNEEADL